MDRGDISMQSNTRPWNGWTGSTIDVYSNQSAMFHRPNSNRHTMIKWRIKLKRLDSHKRVTGIPGAVQANVLVNIGFKNGKHTDCLFHDRRAHEEDLRANRAGNRRTGSHGHSGVHQ